MKAGFSLGNCLDISSHFIGRITKVQGFQGGGSNGKESTCNAGDVDVIPGCDPWVGKIPWRRAWLSAPVFVPGESPWTEESAGYSP